MLLRYAPNFVCPECKNNLTFNNKTKDAKRCTKGFFSCQVCNITYPIIDGIPVFTRNLDHIKKHTANSFGYKWTKFSVIDEYYKKNFLDELPPLDHKTFFKGKSVLDAGTGIGIPSFCIAENGAKDIFAVDISSSVRNAYKNNKKFDNVIVAQADIYKMPFKYNSFDVAVCVAVLQHLPNHEKAMEELLSFLKPGGTIVLWVYANEGNRFVKYAVEPFRKYITRKLPIKIVFGISYLLGVIFHFMAHYLYKPLNRLNITNFPLNEYILYRTVFNFKINTQMIFDQLLAPVSYLFTRQEIEELLNRSDITDFVIRHHNKNSWTVIGEKNGIS